VQTEDRDRFKQEVKAALEGRSLGVREVARRSNGGISSTSVLNMLDGHMPNSDVIIEFAEAVTASETRAERKRLADHLLALAGRRARYEDGARVRRGLLADLRPAAGSPVPADLAAVA